MIFGFHFTSKCEGVKNEPESLMHNKASPCCVLTKYKFGPKSVHAQRQPKAGRNAGQSDKHGVQINARINFPAAKLVHHRPVDVAAQHDRRNVTNGRRSVRESRLVLFEPIEQLRKPDHQRVVAARDAKLDHTGQDGSLEVGWVTEGLGLVPDFVQEDHQVVRFAQAERSLGAVVRFHYVVDLVVALETVNLRREGVR